MKKFFFLLLLLVGVSSCNSDTVTVVTDKTEIPVFIATKVSEIKNDTIPDKYQNTTLEDNNTLYVVENGVIIKMCEKKGCESIAFIAGIAVMSFFVVLLIVIVDTTNEY